MKRLRLLLVLLSFSFAASALGAAQSAGLQSATLKTSDTTVQLVPEARGPRLASLSSGVENIDNRATEELITSAEIGGKSVSLEWKFNAAESRADAKVVSYVYESASPHLRLTWNWEIRSEHGPVEHVTRIENLESREIVLPLQASFVFDWRTAELNKLESLYIEKGADSPTKDGTHLVKVLDDYKWEGKSSSYAQSLHGAAREVIPFVLVEHTTGMQTGFYVGIEFSGRTKLTLSRSGDSLKSEAGLDPLDGEFRTKLKPGEVFETPRVFVGTTHGGPDATANVIRRWVRDVLTDQKTWNNSQYPLVVNKRGGVNLNEEIANQAITDAANLGFEMFHLDAGWSRAVGDWQPDAIKFPHGLAPVAYYAHAKGLKFGLWVDWAQAALSKASGSLNVRDPKIKDWLTTDLPANWKPDEFKGQTIDIGYPPAKAWAMRETDRIVSDYKVDMLEHDGYLVAKGCDRTNHPHAAPDALLKTTYRDAGFLFSESENATDVSYHAARAYYDIQKNMRQKHPGLLLEVRNDGGRMVDFGSAAHGDYFSLTDTTDPLSNRRAFYDASFLFPTAMLEAYVGRWEPEASALDANVFRYMLRSGMMGSFSVMTDTSAWTSEQHDVARREIQTYKDQLRPLIRAGDLYHVSERPDGKQWDGIEYFDPRTGRGVVLAFRGSTKVESSHRFILRGMDPSLTYQIRFHDGSSKDRTFRGDELLTGGVLVSLPKPFSSEMVFVEALPSDAPRR